MLRVVFKFKADQKVIYNFKAKFVRNTCVQANYIRRDYFSVFINIYLTFKLKNTNCNE